MVHFQNGIHAVLIGTGRDAFLSHFVHFTRGPTNFRNGTAEHSVIAHVY